MRALTQDVVVNEDAGAILQMAFAAGISAGQPNEVHQRLQESPRLYRNHCFAACKARGYLPSALQRHKHCVPI